ncbi:hypothetical protein [Leisingera daeponensis]|uniref:hypothetical protein n=1 Tax=Leisingera daeponensis TaxID=405746 RepID=UPI001C987DCE|nr:hypothetical protein [Leisingera daeponensis]MBY6056820.1 hypothetical protein [Leisingera daeponensis]
MNNHLVGRLPTTKNKIGERVRSDNALVYEAASVLRGIITRQKRWSAAGGFHADFGWFQRHLDEDGVLTQKVLTAAGFALDKEGCWTWRGGLWPLSKVTDLDDLGDALVNLVDIHRPL